MISIMNLIVLLPTLGVLIAVKSLQIITIVMIAVAVWPFVPRRIWRRSGR
jgi:hypothetical protein